MFEFDLGLMYVGNTVDNGVSKLTLYVQEIVDGLFCKIFKTKTVVILVFLTETKLHQRLTIVPFDDFHFQSENLGSSNLITF